MKNVTKQYIGLTLEEACSLANSNDTRWRVVRHDEKRHVVTADFVMTRLNFEVDNGIVTHVKLG